jgi:hypothetical protein
LAFPAAIITCIATRKKRNLFIFQFSKGFGHRSRSGFVGRNGCFPQNHHRSRWAAVVVGKMG